MKNLDVLDPVIDYLASQLTAAPVEIELNHVAYCEHISILVDLADYSVIAAGWSDAPPTDLELVGSYIMDELKEHWAIKQAWNSAAKRHGLGDLNAV